MPQGQGGGGRNRRVDAVVARKRRARQTLRSSHSIQSKREAEKVSEEAETEGLARAA